MNKERRKAIDDLMESVEECKNQLEMIRDAEQEAYDNLPEGIQMSERGEVMETAISNLEEAYDSLDSVLESLEAAKE